MGMLDWLDRLDQPRHTVEDRAGTTRRVGMGLFVVGALLACAALLAVYLFDQGGSMMAMGPGIGLAIVGLIFLLVGVRLSRR
jgi:hypothetical protein